MRRLALAALLLIATLAVPVVLAASAPFKATITAPTRTPKVSTKWYYVVRVADLHGKPIAARLTMQIKDPTGQVHAVQYGPTKKNITHWAFTGSFRDYIIWPPSSKLADVIGGLVLRATVTARGAKIVLSYRVKPQ
jgi:hypothetical protein